jgi:hypothetical protein
MTTMNKKPTRCTLVLKTLKLYCVLILLYMCRIGRLLMMGARVPETCRAE